MRVLDHLLKAIRNAAIFNPEVKVAPACILWPDRDRQWEAIMPFLQEKLPELLILGKYVPEKRMGPAIWLRCVIAGKIEGISLLGEQIPILYLPGVSRQDLRAVESCPESLKPLAELQSRGVFWSKASTKDWTIRSYLKSDQSGLGLDVAQDNDTKRAMQLALCRFLDEDVSLLQGKRLDSDYFNTLLTGGDPIRALLQWFDQGDAFRNVRNENEWQALVEICKSQLDFDPQNEGVLAGCIRLANHEGPWRSVWERYKEAPRRYPNIPAQIRKNHPPCDMIFWHMEGSSFEGWPQWNDEQEKNLRQDLIALACVPAHEARTKICKLEEWHGRRRSFVWAELGDAPLAYAVKYLACLADITQKNLAAGTVKDLATGYCNYGWQADDSMLRALAHVGNPADIDAVTTAIRAIYLPWVEESARYLQKLMDNVPYPGGDFQTAKEGSFNSGDCVLFVDGLRFDAGKRLVRSLERLGFVVSEEPFWSALPSVTATGKAAVSPVRDKIHGKENSPDFEPSVASTGQSLKGGYPLKKLLIDEGWVILDRSSDGNGQGKAWCEFGDIDHEGHVRGCELAKHLDALIDEITERIVKLVAADWKRVIIVTDHGWLLMPGGLPKVDLPSVLANSRWKRCASLKPGAISKERLYPWYWDPSQGFALADGVSCFKKGEEYAHGGLSLQECLTLHLTVTPGKAPQIAASIKLTEWRGLRCTVAVDGNHAGLSLDIRSQAGNASSSVVVSSKPFKEDGTASVVVEDEDLEGQEATVVLIDSKGMLLAQHTTVIGGGN